MQVDTGNADVLVRNRDTDLFASLIADEDVRAPSIWVNISELMISAIKR